MSKMSCKWVLQVPMQSCSRQSLMNPFRPKNSSVTYPLKVSTMSDVEQLTENSSGMLGEQVTKVLSRVLEAPKQPSEKMPKISSVTLEALEQPSEQVLKISSVTLEALEQPSKHVPKFSTEMQSERLPKSSSVVQCEQLPTNSSVAQCLGQDRDSAAQREQSLARSKSTAKTMQSQRHATTVRLSGGPGARSSATRFDSSQLLIPKTCLRVRAMFSWIHGLKMFAGSNWLRQGSDKFRVGSFTQSSCTEELLHREAFTQSSFYIQVLLHKAAFTHCHKHFCRQAPLHTETHFSTQKPLHTEARSGTLATRNSRGGQSAQGPTSQSRGRKCQGTSSQWTS